MDKKLQKLEEEQRKLMEIIEENNRKINSDHCVQERHGKNDLIEFFVGLLLLGGGLFWIFQSVRVTTSWGSYFLHVGTVGIPNGVIIIPLLIGIIMLFVMKRKIFGWIVTSIGVLSILISIITSVSFHFVSQSLFSYILMFGFTAVGAALVIKATLTKH